MGGTGVTYYSFGNSQGNIPDQDVTILGPDPGIVFDGTETGALWSEIREVAGGFWQTQNAEWNGLAWTQVNPAQPSYAIQKDAAGNTLWLSAPAASPTPIVWTTYASISNTGAFSGTVATGVTAVTGSGNIASSGGTAPNITFTGILPVANGGNGSSTPGIVAGANVSVAGAWPNYTVSATGSTGVSSVLANSPLNSSGGTTPTISVNTNPAFSGNLSASGTITGTQFNGSGAGLSAATVPNAALVTTPINVGASSQTKTGAFTAAGLNSTAGAAITGNLSVSGGSTLAALTASGAAVFGSTLTAAGKITSPAFGTPNNDGIFGAYNVQDYGATGNGSTDDSAAINAAISAAAATSGTVFFPPGTYLCNAASIAATYTTQLVSFGYARITGTANPLISATGISANNYESFTMVGLSVVPTGTNSALNLTATSYASFGAATRIDNCTFVGNPSQNETMITVKYAANVLFNNVQIFGSIGGAATNTGVVLNAASVFFSNCIFQGLITGISHIQDGSGSPAQDIGYVNCSINACQTGISSSGSYGWAITGSEVANCKYGILIDSDGAVSIVGCFFGTSSQALSISSTGAHTYPANGIYVAGNVFNIAANNFGAGTGLSATPVVIITGSSASQVCFSITLQGNVINAPGISPAPGYGIGINYAAGITVQSNQVQFTPTVSAISLQNMYTAASILGYTNLFTFVRGNAGINPPGGITVPSVLTSLGSGNFQQNTTGYDCTVYITGGTVTSVGLRGLAGTDTIGTSGGTFRVPSGSSIGVNFTGSPTWYWVAD